MKIIDIRLNKDKLMQLPELERTLFLALGHVVNEITSLSKMLYWSTNAPSRNDAEDRGRLTLELLLLRLLAGKLNEAWELFAHKYFGTALSKIYDPMLDENAMNVFKRLKSYFSKENACNMIRNQFAFHDSPEAIAAILPNMNEELHIYLERGIPVNNLFAYSEELLLEAILSELRKLKDDFSLDELVKEIFSVAAWFTEVTDAILFKITDAKALDIRQEQPIEVVFEDLPTHDSVVIPWFTDTTKY